MDNWNFLYVTIFSAGMLLVLIYLFFSYIARLRKAGDAEREQAWRELVSDLRRSPSSLDIQDRVYEFVRANPQFRGTAYKHSLQAVQASRGSPESKSFALEMGRFVHGSSRPEGGPTIYDEQAIQNDIQARC
ncbi:hypothetical protein OAE40_00600 [Rubripirellula sp.]|nr:hypothetical protein [Rubripirellula sp.]MDB4654254.1 hypothetical protein [Rubripirellula sp.]